MFLTLLLVTFIFATVVSVIVAASFKKPVDQMLRRIIGDEIAAAWRKYLMFAIYVVGISSGVRIADLEKYITNPPPTEGKIVELTGDRWVLEVYRTIIESLQGLAWVLFVFFIIALIAFVLVRTSELRRARADAAAKS